MNLSNDINICNQLEMSVLISDFSVQTFLYNNLSLIFVKLARRCGRAVNDTGVSALSLSGFFILRCSQRNVSFIDFPLCLVGFNFVSDTVTHLTNN